MDFCFSDEFKALTVSCPPEDYNPKNITVFRWVFADIRHKKNFTPRYYLVPSAELEKVDAITDSRKRDSKKCAMLALSFFDSEKAAIERFNFFLKGGKTVYKRFGTHIASCEIGTNDGVNEEPNDIGHFNHHPAKDHNYEERFKIVSKL